MANQNEDNSSDANASKNKIDAPPGCENLPLDEEILSRALMLLNLTMSSHLMKKWI